MCGIAGIQLNETLDTSSEFILQQLLAALNHRGPDGQGIKIFNNTALVHTRLAIIDLTGGAQPLSSSLATLVANGEIYNYKELASALAPGELQTKSDCEIPLHLWPLYHKDYVQSLRGMYAIALYDHEQELLILSRDPFGIKPLYYAKLPNGMAFASEPQALIKAGLLQARLNKSAQVELLQLNFTLGSKTIFEGIQRVLPGQSLMFKKGELINQSQQVVFKGIQRKNYTEKDALQNLEQVLKNSISLHLQSDVPYGIFLSSGIDSSLILSFMTELSSQPVLSYTAGFDVPNAVDERRRAADIATRAGAKHESIEINEDMVWRHLPEIVGAMDDPCADYAIIPTWFLARHARDKVKVVLSGEGGDELFAGYGRYRQFARSRWLGGKVMRGKGNFDRVDVLHEKPIDWRDELSKQESQIKKLFSSRLLQAQALDCADWLPHDLLLKLDRCLMAHGIEGRTPFLDPVVADFAISLPDTLKLRRGFGKWLLRTCLQKRLAHSEAFSPKQGFTVPIGDWIAKHGESLGRLIAKQAGIQELAEPKKVIELYKNIHQKRGASAAAWNLLFYALWHQHNVLGVSAKGSIWEVLEV